MSQSRAKKKLTVLSAIFIIIVVGIIGFTGWFAWHSKQVADKTLTDAAKIAQTSTAKPVKATPVTTFAECKSAAGSILQESYPETCVTKAGKRFIDTSNTTLSLQNSGLSLDYDSTAWKVEAKTSTKDQYCGLEDNATLAYQIGINLEMHISLGACGKGGGICYEVDVDSCLTDVKDIATVNVSDTQVAYVTADRLSFDNGKTWQYELWLTSNKDCKGEVCGFTVPGFTSNPGLIDVTVTGEGAIPGNPQSLADFVNLDGVKSAIAILKSARF
jgi:hypothetical protein